MQIQYLHDQGYSIRKIAKTLGIHRSTVKRHLYAQTFPGYRKRSQKTSVILPYQQTIQDYLSEDSYSATWLWDRLQKMGYAGSYATVLRYVQKIKERTTRLAYLRFETEPGHQAQVDWGDFQVTEPSGRTSTVYMFVMVLGYSRQMWAGFVNRCTMETFMDCHIAAFHYFQGIPSAILYDNMKNVVMGRDGQGKPVFNLEFLDFARHYGFQPQAAPPYSPWVKGKVERPVDYIRERFWRGYVFTGIQKANEEILKWLNETGNQRVHGTHHEVVKTRWMREVPHLKPLPPLDYDTALKAFRKVYKDCLLSYNGNRYRVPHRFVGKTVLLKAKDDVLKIYYDQELLAHYRIPADKHQLVSDSRFEEQLRQDRDQLRRKYGRHKGKATRGLTHASLYSHVFYRPLSDYEPYAQGGISWNN